MSVAPFVHSIDRIPPNNLEAEMALLGSILVDKAMMPTVSEIVQPSDFHAPLHETIYLALHALYERGEPLDKVALAGELKNRGLLDKIGGMAYVNSLTDTVPTAASAEYYARIVRDKSLLRGLIQAGTRLAALGYDETPDALGEAQRDLASLAARATIVRPEWDDTRPLPVLDAAALHGLSGEIVRATLPETEADPAAMLISLLVAVGNAAGDGRRMVVGDDRHPARLFAAVAGATAAGGKGTSWGATRPYLRAAAPEWFTSCIKGGFGSGEAIVAELGGLWRDRSDETGEAEPPIEHRALIVEPELARLLTVNQREGSTASPILRGAWDDGKLELRRAKDRLIAEGAHLSILGHITPDELRSKLTGSEIASGLANRFIFALSRRSKKLPSGGNVDQAVIGRLGGRLHDVITHALTSPRIMRRTAAAEDLWTHLYCEEPDREGVIGELTARAHPQKLRLAVAYAILDRADEIDVPHVLAAEAVWRYSVASVEHIWGGATGDPVQDRLLEQLRDRWPNGLDGTEQRNLFARHISAARLHSAREALERRGLVRTVQHDTGGRPRVVSVALARAERGASVHVERKGQTSLSALTALFAPRATTRAYIGDTTDDSEEVLLP